MFIAVSFKVSPLETLEEDAAKHGVRQLEYGPVQTEVPVPAVVLERVCRFLQEDPLDRPPVEARRENRQIGQAPEGLLDEIERVLADAPERGRERPSDPEPKHALAQRHLELHCPLAGSIQGPGKVTEVTPLAHARLGRAEAPLGRMALRQFQPSRSLRRLAHATSEPKS